MNRIHRIAIAALLLVLSAGAAAAAAESRRYPVGETERVFHPAEARHWRGAKAEALWVRIWYPAGVGAEERPHDIGPPNRPIFRGHPVAIDAPLAGAGAAFPLLLLSHGTGGSADSLDWLGAALAARGYIVAAPNHPGNNALEPLTPEGFLLWWERAKDQSQVLDGVLADRMFGARVDRQRIGAAGFSLGGYTSLLLAGARSHRQALLDFCASPAADVACHPPETDALATKTGGMTLAQSAQTQASLARSDASYRDPRIKAAFAIAPALGPAFDATSFADVRVPIALIAGSADTTVPVATNIRRIAGFLPKARFALLEGAGHYTFLDVCTPAAADALPAFCKDGPGVKRESAHADAIGRVDAFFAANLPAQR